MRQLSVILSIVLLTALSNDGKVNRSEAKVGERHVEFTLADIETGKPVSLSDFRGKKVLLIQFASW